MSTRSHPESARIIREARQAAGLTQLELAEKLGDRKSTRLNSSHRSLSRMPSSA